MKEIGITFSGALPQKIRDGLKTETRRVASGKVARCEVGDVLYVRETQWRLGKWIKNGLTDTGRQKWRFDPHDDGIPPRYDKPNTPAVKRDGLSVGWVYRHARFMPKAMAQTRLQVLAVRREPLHALTEADARAEGVGSISEFIALWNRLNPDWRWETNPLVDVIQFSRM